MTVRTFVGTLSSRSFNSALSVTGAGPHRRGGRLRDRRRLELGKVIDAVGVVLDEAGKGGNAAALSLSCVRDVDGPGKAHNAIEIRDSKIAVEVERHLLIVGFKLRSGFFRPVCRVFFVQDPEHLIAAAAVNRDRRRRRVRSDDAADALALALDVFPFVWVDVRVEATRPRISLFLAFTPRPLSGWSVGLTVKYTFALPWRASIHWQRRSCSSAGRKVAT